MQSSDASKECGGGRTQWLAPKRSDCWVVARSVVHAC